MFNYYGDDVYKIGKAKDIGKRMYGYTTSYIKPVEIKYASIKCKIMLIINKLDILVYLFKDYIKGEYERIYQLSKKKAVHLIITNY